MRPHAAPIYFPAHGPNLQVQQARQNRHVRMNVLVTGAAGFIGFHASRALLAAGHTVTGLDNFNDYYAVALKEARWSQLTGGSNGEPVARFNGHRLDITDLPALDALHAAGNFDVVLHLAAQPGVRYSIDHPHVYQRANLEGFLNILECARHHKVPRLVYASSSSVYGGNRDIPFAEDDRVDTPVSLYAATKKANELMAHTYSHLYGLQTIGLRFFTVYGPWGRPDMAPWLFTDAIHNGRPIKVFNHGDMQRDFTYIDDIIDGVLAAIQHPHLPGYAIFNLGNQRPERLLDFIQAFADALGVEPEMNFLPMQPGDVHTTCADIDLARTVLGYEPTTPIRVGVPKFVEWFLEYSSPST